MSQTAQSKPKPKFMVGPSADGPYPVGRLYFGYGSNLSSMQMCSRCPDSEGVGLGFLPGYRFIINQRGFANVVRAEPASTKQGEVKPQPDSNDEGKTIDATTTSNHEEEQGVYGVVYALGEGDEELLDGFEGVSTMCYTKEMHDIQVLDSSGEWETKPVLVYIDRLRVSEDVPRREYVTRMNRGVDEATREWGLPQEYVDDAIRRFIPRAPAF